MRLVVSDTQLQNGVNCRMKIKNVFTFTESGYINGNILKYRIEGDENLYTIGYNNNPLFFGYYNYGQLHVGFLELDLKVIYAQSLTSNLLFYEVEIDDRDFNIFISQLKNPSNILLSSNITGLLYSLLYEIASGGPGFMRLTTIKNAQQINIPANTQVNITLNPQTRYVYMFDTSMGSFSGIGALRLIFNNVEIPINPNILYPLGQGITISVVNTSSTTQYTLIIYEF